MALQTKQNSVSLSTFGKTYRSDRLGAGSVWFKPFLQFLREIPSLCFPRAFVTNKIVAHMLPSIVSSIL